MAIHKKGLAHWEGDLKHGKGTVSTESGALSQQPYGFNTRFEGVKGTNPEELIGAAHAACFSMALSLMLSEEGYTATSIDTTAVVTLNKNRRRLCDYRYRAAKPDRPAGRVSGGVR
ncbi:osmotically inducible protein C [Klebsiella pneumoniae]|uniref:Osmotically inducible protein C n=1 Tax=Klebsiella pneumoniae TaxID=573 RepID=A0A2X3EXL6_KLEPN|nr:osmotically inducible protein C [Klebsiella pneumoniae]